MNQTKNPVVQAHFGGNSVNLRWDYNTIAELQDLGYDFTDDAFVKSVVGDKDNPKKPSLKMLRAFACAALRSGSEDDAELTVKQVGRTVSNDGAASDVFAKVNELMKLAHGEAEPDAPLAEPGPPSE